MLFGIILDEQSIKDNCKKTWRSEKSFVYLYIIKKLDININKNQMSKIRVNQSNSKVLNGRLFITELKALFVSKSKVIAELI